MGAAMCHGAPLVILDEPTAPLDPRTEYEVLGDPRALTAGSTAVAISHRLARARSADRIVVLEGGRIIEAGHMPYRLAA